MRGATPPGTAPVPHRGVAVIAAALLTTLSGPAAAAPPAPRFGPVIEGYARYVAPERCRPRPKPGVIAFRDLLLETYPDSTWTVIERACSGTATSDHQEGRALDWARDATDDTERAQVEDLLGWLLATDAYGNPHAMLRRLGIVYLVWDRRIWGTWSQAWEVYCVQEAKRCRDPESGAALDPHTDHIHISFGWRGARMKTTFWNPTESYPVTK